MQVQYVLFNGGTKYQDVVQVYSHTAHKVGERQVHQPLEGSRGIAQANGNHQVFKQSLRC